MILVALGAGCSTNKNNTNPGGGDGVGIVIIQMTTDTLAYLPGDSVSAAGSVVVTDAQGRVMPNVKVNISLSESFGLIEFVDQSRRDTTNSLGRVEFIFRAYAANPGPGHNTITATVGNKSAQWLMVVQPAQDIIAQINIVLDKREVAVSQARPDSVQVTVAILNQNRVGIPNITVTLGATGGLLTQLPVTNASGVANTWWYSYGTSDGWYYLNARAGQMTAVDSIRVTRLTNERGMLTLTTVPAYRMVRADNGITGLSITATLKDPTGVALQGDTILFAAPRMGSVQGRAITDSLGQAIVRFTGGGVPNAAPGDSAVVVARWASGGLVDSVRIRIEPAALVNQILLLPGTTEGIAGVDSTPVNITATYEDGSPVNNEIVDFTTTCGWFSVPTDTVRNGRAIHQNYYHFCNTKSSAAHPVMINASIGHVVSDSIRMNVYAGPPRFIRVTASSPVIPINEQCVLTAAVTDSLHNAVDEGVPVSFTATMGTLSSPLIHTNRDGLAIVTLTPGTQAGNSIVKGSIVSGAYADSVLISILSDIPGTIQLDVSNPSPQVAGTGGQDWTQLMATVRDRNGNNVPDGVWVWFKILAGPNGGENINRRGLMDSAQTAAGVAMATFNSGLYTGPVQIKAWTFRVEGTDTFEISAQASNISIVAGPPKNMDIQTSDVGVDAGSAWDVTVAALVRDSLNNPVRDGVAVFFEVHGINGADTAAILSDTVTTGNGMHRPGMAYTILRYISDATNEIVLITGRTAGVPGSYEGIEETIQYTLPIQQPTLSLYALPNSWHYNAPGQEGTCYIECVSIVRDGHNTPINKARVIYGASRGRLYQTRTANTTTSFNYTGPLYGSPPFSPGHTSVWLRETADLIFPDPQSPEITGDVTAEIEGYPDAVDAVTINFRR
jgi:hypothetical protein